jgi:hypothetical protein
MNINLLVKEALRLKNYEFKILQFYIPFQVIAGVNFTKTFYFYMKSLIVDELFVFLVKAGATLRGLVLNLPALE